MSMTKSLLAVFHPRIALNQGLNPPPPGHSGKAELGKRPLQPQARPVKSRVMPRPAQPGDREPGLLWIEFPRVDVERAWHTATFAILQRLLNQHVRQHPEVGAAGCREAHSETTQRRGRDLSQAACWPLQPVRVGAASWIPVAPPTDRK